MKKIFIVVSVVLLSFCVMNINQTDVAAATYTEEQILNGEVGSFQSGDTITFSNTPTITFYDRNGVLLDTQTASIITVPEYALTTANFRGWGIIGSHRVGNEFVSIQLQASILPTLSTTAVTQGESVTFSFNESDLPLPHDYHYQWITGGPAGGVNLDGSPDATTFTITKDSPYYKDGFIIACRITNSAGTHRFYTSEAIVTLNPTAVPEEETSSNNQKPSNQEPSNANSIATNAPTQSNVNLVKTGDNYALDIYGFLMTICSCIVVMYFMKRKRII